MSNSTVVVYELANTAINALIARHYVNAEYLIQGLFAYSYAATDNAYLRRMLSDMILFDLPRDKSKAMDYLNKIVAYCEAASLV